MEARDLIVTPLLIVLIFIVAYVVRPTFTNHETRKYFLPALMVRILGALAVGFIYQFYYNGGDTFAYHTHGSRHIWEAFMESPAHGIQLLFSNGEYGPGLWEHAEKIWYWRDESAFFVIRIATLFDMFTFSSYSGTAVLFAVFSFIGAWCLFQTFYKENPGDHRWIAFATLFIPTVIFWGSGIFKDSLTMAALGILTHSCHLVFIRGNGRVRPGRIVLIILSAAMIYSIKVYILACFIPALILWWGSRNVARLKSSVLRFLVAPLAVIVIAILGFIGVSKVTENDPRYNLSNLSTTARITAYDIRYGWGARMGEGSGFTLGELDGTWQSMVRLAPAAINVSLFRPYPWEVRNPLMLLSAAEGMILLVFTIVIILGVRQNVFRYLKEPNVLFCLCFAITFAFAVGVSTFNFGTLSRYKIPMMPYFVLGIRFLHGLWNRDRNLAALASTE
jgi:hypothetical protein